MSPHARVEIIANLSDAAHTSLMSVLPDFIGKEIERGLVKFNQKLAAAEVVHHHKEVEVKQNEMDEALRASNDPLKTAAERASAFERLDQIENEIVGIEVPNPNPN